jgi:hypothetical protein
MPRGPPKISRAISGFKCTAVIEQPEFWLTHHAVLASVLAISSITGTYCAGNNSAPPSDFGSSMRNRPRSISASISFSGRRRSASISAEAATRDGAISCTRARYTAPGSGAAADPASFDRLAEPAFMHRSFSTGPAAPAGRAGAGGSATGSAVPVKPGTDPQPVSARLVPQRYVSQPPWPQAQSI